jgi:NitT/TauT family transport system substrate-binding protein
MKVRTSIIALISTALMASGCGGSGKPAAGSPHRDQVTLLLNWYPYGEHAPLYYGLKHGIFAEYGIDLKIEAGQGSGKTVQAVGANQADFGWADTPALMQAVSKGLPVKSLGVYLQTTPASVQFFSNRGFSSPSDLKGKKIAGTAGDALSKTFPVFLAKNGLIASDVTIQNTDAAGKIASTISGQVDALLGNANDQGPTLHGKTGKPVTAMKFADFGLNYFSDGLIASDGELAKTDLVQRMVKAVSESWAGGVAHPADAVAAMSGAEQQLPTPAVLTEQFTTTIALLHTPATAGKAPGLNTEADWQQTIATITAAGLVPSAQPVATYWDESAALK